jgi:hypothetical protein
MKLPPHLTKLAAASGLAWIALLSTTGETSSRHRSPQRLCAVTREHCGGGHVYNDWRRDRKSRARERAAAKDAVSIRQLPPHLRSVTPLAPVERCRQYFRGHCRAPLDLPEILLAPPNPASIDALNRYRIPAINDVPPIVTLDSRGTSR